MESKVTTLKDWVWHNMIVVFTFVFTLGALYASFTSLQTNIELKLNNQEKFLTMLVSQQTNRIQNLENVMIGQYKDVKFVTNNVKDEVIKTRKNQRLLNSSSIIKDTVYIIKNITEK
jgi:hypothetical protein